MTDAPSIETAEKQDLVSHRRGPIAILTLNRPEQRNSLSERLLERLMNELDRLGEDNEIRCIIINHALPVFCAGHDLKELLEHRDDSDGGQTFYEEVMGMCADLMLTISRLPKPVIAAVGGTATAAGCQLVAACDLAVAAESAKFCTPGINIGLFCSTPMVALTRNVGRKRAMAMLLLGEMITASEAKEIGLVNRVVPPHDVMNAALAMAELIAAKSPATVAIGKEAFYKQIDMPMHEAYRYAAEVMVRNMMERDAEEGIEAFLDKRRPQWERS